MTRHEIAALACRILALWLVAQAVFTGLGWMGSMVVMLFVSVIYPEESSRSALMGTFTLGVMVMALLATGVALWFLAERIARLLVSQDTTPVTRSDVTTQSVMAVALAAVGAFILVQAVRGLVAELIRVLQGDYPFSEWWASANWQATIWSDVTGLAMAIALIVAARRIASRLLGSSTNIA